MKTWRKWRKKGTTQMNDKLAATTGTAAGCCLRCWQRCSLELTRISVHLLHFLTSLLWLADRCMASLANELASSTDRLIHSVSVTASASLFVAWQLYSQRAPKCSLFMCSRISLSCLQCALTIDVQPSTERASSHGDLPLLLMLSSCDWTKWTPWQSPS